LLEYKNITLNPHHNSRALV